MMELFCKKSFNVDDWQGVVLFQNTSTMILNLYSNVEAAKSLKN